ncbi:MAG TPA: S8 family serine peptidase [Verrucomicrobiae bacterium]
MRSRPKFWLAVCLLCLAGAWFFWQQGNRWAAQPTAAARAKAVHAKPAVATSMATVKSASTAPVLFSSHNAATNSIGKTNEFAYRLSNTKKTIGELVNNPHAILLDNALIDTDARLDLSFPKNLQASADPGSYIVQSRGPLDNAFRAMLAAAGAQIISYIPNNAYLVEISAMGAASVKGSPMVQAVIPNAPYYKISSSLFDATEETKNLSADTVLTLGLFTDVAPQTVKQIEKLGGVVVGTDRSPFGPIVRVQAPKNWTALAALPGVEIVEAAHRRAEANDLSRVTMGVSTDTLVPTNYMNLNGSNVVVEVNDTGIDANHPDLTGRVSADFAGSLLDTDGHGTFVAGQIAGSGLESTTVTDAQGSLNPGTLGQYRGNAPLATLYSVGGLVNQDGETGHDTNAPISDSYFQEQPARTNALISNNSWVKNGDAAYDLSAASYDAAVRDALPEMTGSQPVLFVFAAGNDGNGDDAGGNGNPDSIDSPGTAKNVITVGALEQARNITNIVTDLNGSSNAVWSGESDTSYEVADYSSRGNVGIGTEGTYGRFKPDVVAPGSFVISTRSADWDQAAYYNPTNIYDNYAFNQPVDTNSLNYYSFSDFGFVVRSNAVNVSIQLYPFSPDPAPTNLPIYVSLDNFPDPTDPTTYDFETTKDNVTIPPDGPANYLASIVNNFGDFNFGVGDSTNVPVTYNMQVEMVTTNDLGNYYSVLSNLNNSIGTGNASYPGGFYRYESGTSMSAANVSGVLALMQDYFTNRLGLRPSPALLKAILINGARPTYLYNYQVDGSINFEGWGLINLPNSIHPSLTNSPNNANTSCFFVDQSPTNALATGDSRTYKISLSPGVQGLPLRVTLVWTDPPGNPAAAIKLVNNLDLVVTNFDNPANPVIYYGNDIAANRIYNTPETTNNPSNFDAINNVQNVFIAASSGTNFSITVLGAAVNVNAVSAQTNDAAENYEPNVVQDFALVVASGDGSNTNGFAITSTSAASNPVNDQRITYITGTNTSALLNQFVGASSPLLGTNMVSFTSTNSTFVSNAVLTIGQTNQWHFYVVTNLGVDVSGGTNSSDVTNAAFITFQPSTLSIPRIGVFADSDTNSTRPEADIDLYVSTSSSLTNLDPTVIANCINSTQVGASLGGNFSGASLGRGGSEFVVDTNSIVGQVYYVGVQSQDQMASEYDFLSEFSSVPFSQTDNNGNEIVQYFSVNIPDGTATLPGFVDTIGLALYPITIQQVTQTSILYQQNPGDLVVTLDHADANGNSSSVILLNHDSPNEPGTYTNIYNDSNQGDTIGSQPSDGPGSLQSFVGQQGSGVWDLHISDNAPGFIGNIHGSQFIEKHQDLGKGVSVLVPSLNASNAFFDYIDVPVGATNLTISVTNETLPTPGPLQLFLKFGSEPSPTNFDEMTMITNVTLPNYWTGSISIGPYLQPGRYFIELLNPGPNAQGPIYISASISSSESAISTVDYDSSGSVPILDDAVTTTSLFVTNTDIIQSLNIGLRVDHPRISDLVFHLIAPDGTRYLLMENRGGASTNGAGVTIITTNATVTSQNIEELPAADYPVGPIADGWSVMKNQVSVVTNPANTFQSGNFLALANGVISNTLPTVAGQTYTLTFAYRGPGIVSMWRGEGNPNDSVSTNNGTLVNSATYGPGYVGGQAFKFNGANSAVVINDSADLKLSNSLSIDAWVNPSAFTRNQSQILFRGDTRNCLDPYTLGDNDANVVNGGAWFHVADTSAGCGVDAVTPSLLPLNQWTHVAGTFDGNTGIMRVYTNGVLAVEQQSDERPFGDLDPNSSPNVVIGNINGNFDENFDGLIDEVSIYKRALSASEVAAIAQNGSAGKFDTTLAFPQNLAEATVSLQGNSPVTLLGANTNWQIYTNTFTATQNGTPLQITGLEPGMLLTAMSLTPQANVQYEYLTFTEDTNLTTTPIKYAVPPFQATGTLASNNVPAADVLEGPITNPANGHLYYLVASNTWTASEAVAVQLGSHLATINDAAEDAWVYSTFSDFGSVQRGYWIGLYDPSKDLDTGATHEANFVWVSGDSATYRNWGSGEPNNGGTVVDDEWYVHVFSPTDRRASHWNDIYDSGGGYANGGVAEVELPEQNVYYLPEQDISGLNGQSAFGTWQLEIQDDRAGAGLTNSLVSWQLQFTFATTNFVIPTAPIALTNTTPETNVVSSNSITWYSVFVPLNADIATNRLISASAPVNLLFNQTAPDTNGASTLLENVPSGSTNLSTTTAPQLMPGMIYYLGVQNTNDFDVTNVILEVDFHFLAAGAPFAFTQPATLVTGTSAQLNGFATPNGFPATAWFQWGTTTNYGSNTPPVNVGTLLNVVYTNSQISGLVKNVPYHFRLVVSNALAVTPGFDQILDEANVVAWGANYLGQSTVPRQLQTNLNVTAIAAAYQHSLAIQTNEQVTAWGEDTSGQTNIPPGVSNVMAVAGGQYYSLALETNGTIAAWGENILGTPTNVPPGLSNAVMIAGGTYAGLALQANGTVVAWGISLFGLTNIPPGLSNVVSIAGGGYHNLAIKNDGTVAAWGDDSAGQINVPPGLTNVVAVSAGLIHSLALKADGTVVAWGDNSDGQTNVPDALSNVVAIAAGGFHSVALRADGTIVAWGDDTAGQTSIPSGLTNVVAISAGYLHNLALTPQSIFNLTNIVVSNPPTNGPQTNTIPPQSVTFYQISVPINADFATNSLLFAEAPLDVWFTTNTPPTLGAPNDKLLLADVTNDTYVLKATSSPPLIPGSTYYLGVQNTNGFSVNYGISVTFHLLTATSAPVSLSSITQTNNGTTNGFLLKWFAPTNDIFQVQFTTNLASADWLTFSNIITYTGSLTPTNGLFTFFDDGSQYPFGTTRFYRLILLGSLNNGAPQTSTVSSSGINYFSITVPANADFATNILLSASAPVNLLFNQTATPTGANAGDFTLLTHSTGGLSILGLGTAPPLVPGSTYFLGVQNTNSLPVNFSLKVDFHLLTATSAPVSISGIISTNNGGGTNGFLLTWFAPSNELFQVQWTASLAPTSWATFTNIISYNPGAFTSPANTQFNFFDDGSQTGGVLDPIRFYRLILYGSSPAFSAPTISSVFINTNGVNLQWSGSSGEGFKVQWKTNLAPIVNWNTFSGIVTSPNTSFNYLDDGTQSGGLDGVKFYRLMVFP